MKHVFQFILILGLYLLTSGSMLGQSLTFSEDENLVRAINKYKELNFGQEKISVWKVQVMVTSDRRLMETNLKKLSNEYKDIKFSWDFRVPYYYLKCGIYANKTDALGLVYEMKTKNYASAVAVNEQVEAEEYFKDFSFKY